MKKKYYFIVIALFCEIISFAQEKDSVYVAPFILKSKYLSYLFVPDSNTKSTLFTLKYQYAFTGRNEYFRTGGTHFNVGFNLSRLFTQKFILGFCADFKFAPGFTRQFFSQDFIDDYNANYIAIQENDLDSLRSDILYNAINGLDGYRTRGNVLFNFGICLSLFPHKYGGILVEFKKGGSTYPFYGDYSSKGLTEDDGLVFLETSKNYSVELSFNPYKFFNSSRVKVLNQKAKDIYKFFIISLYYEKFSLGTSTFDGIPLTKFVNQNFISKYGNDDRFGVKIGLALY